jgi:hypothetical protein
MRATSGGGRPCTSVLPSPRPARKPRLHRGPRAVRARQTPCSNLSFPSRVSLQPAIPRRVAPQQSPLPLHQSPTIIAQFQSSEPTKIPLLNFTAGYRQTRAPQALAKDGPKGRDRLRHSNRNPETKRLIASARQGAIGVIYPNLPWLMRFNSRPINAGRYLIGWRGLSESLRRRICGCALLP